MNSRRDSITDWEGDAVLADGATVHIRELRADDEPLLARMYGGLSDNSLYLRFFSPVPRETATRLEMKGVGEAGHAARVALLGGEVVAAARYDAIGNGVAEVAFVVADEHQGRGVGTLLLEHLAVIARSHGIHTFEAQTLPGNSNMLGVFAAAGWERECHFVDGTVHTHFSIEPSESSRAAIADREHRAEVASMTRLFVPRSVAVIGAARAAGKVGHTVMENLVGGGFAGAVYPVNPNATSVAGIRAYASVTEIPEPVDLAVIVRPPDAMLGLVDECARKGVHSLVILSSGFAELGEDGAALQHEIVTTARANGMRVVGPNCLGVVNTDPDVRLNATFAPSAPIAGNVAFLSQSGGLGSELLSQAAARGIGVSEFVSVGNKSDVSGNDLLQYWEDDPRTGVILLYLESFGNPGKFARIARRVARRKPVLAVKSGRTTAGGRAASSHTAALASSDVAVDALFRQAGVIRVDTLEELLDTAQLLANQPLPRGPRVAIIGNTGGPGILAVDACEGAGLRVVERDPAAGGNPVDLGTAAAPESYEQALSAVLHDDDVDAAIVLYAPPGVADARAVARAVADVAGVADKPVLACFLGRLDVAEELRGAHAWSRTVPAYSFPENAARALGRAAQLAAWRRRPEGRIAEFVDVDGAAARRLVVSRLERANEASVWLDDDAVAALMRCYGIPTTPPDRAESSGLEMLVGVRQDPLFGPLLLFGAGGINAELLADRALRILPITDEDAHDLVRSLRTSPLLFGYRGSPELDVAALEDVIARVAKMAEDVPEITEMDLNPIVVGEHGVSVSGVKVRCAPAPRRPPPDLRRTRD